MARSQSDTAPLRPGMRQTRQRQQVWEAIRQLGGHCTADEITAELQRSRPGFSRSTVYRALEFLQDQGLVHKLESRAAFVGCIAEEDHDHGALA